MQFDREELLSVLADASPALARTLDNSISGLDHFWFDEKYVYAYNGWLGVRIVFKSDLDCGVPGKALMDLLRTSALKEIDMAEVKDDVVLKMGKSRVTLVSLEGDRNPWHFAAWDKTAKGKKKVEGLELTGDVLEAFTRVSFVRRVGKPLQVVHNGITVVPQESTTEFYSTDSASMARVTLGITAPKSVPKFIAPWGFVDRMLALMAPGASLFVLDDCLIAEGDGVLVCSNLLSLPDDPDLPKTVDEFYDSKALAAELPAGLQSILDRAAILNKGAAQILITAEGKRLFLEGKYPLGALDEELAVKSNLDDFSGKFEGEFVRRGLSTAKSISLTPKVMILKDGDDFIYLISTVYTPKKAKAEKTSLPRKELPVDDGDEIPF